MAEEKKKKVKVVATVAMRRGGMAWKQGENEAEVTSECMAALKADKNFTVVEG